MLGRIEQVKRGPTRGSPRRSRTAKASELRARLEGRAGITPFVAPAQAVRDERDNQ
jgi:hypothetical protein